jgi:hypothetical protein
VVQLPALVADYAQLPHVVSATPNGYFTCEACGCASDLCLDPGDGGAWTWLWRVETNQCGRVWYRSLSESDGGLRVEQ